MNTLKLLEFDRIRDQIAEQCRTDGAALRIRGLKPDNDATRLSTVGRQVALLLMILEEGRRLPGTRVGDIRGGIETARVAGAILDPEALLAIRRVFDAAEEWDRLFTSLNEDGVKAEPLLEVFTPGGVPERLHRELRELIADDGSIREEAIPEVARLRGALNSIRLEIRSTAATMIRDSREIYREDVPTIRDGRTVLPLRADFKGRVDGIIHEASGSGDTLFVEPTVLVDLNNAGVRTEAEIHVVIHRLLRQLSDAVRSEIETIAVLSATVEELDLVAARARYGNMTRGRIVSARDSIDLRGARHPLLGSTAVPLHIEFGEGTRLLVVSGPNTGGKTVLLKTLGLLAVMNQCAIPIPVEADSALPIFSDFAVSIGDEQSIDEALSTFSAHIRSLAGIASAVHHRSLVLLDEVATGTDPEEGAALAMALIDHLLEVGATILVTTHLTVLKHYGYTREAASNASMEFDDSTHRPTFRVVPGKPGSSHALDTARRFGLPEPVLAQAERYMGDRAGSVGEILRRLEEQERQQRELRLILDHEKSELDRLRSELRSRRLTIEAQELALRTEGLRDLERDLARARSEIEAEVRRLRERRDAISDEEIRRSQSVVREAEEIGVKQRQEIARLEREQPQVAPVLPNELAEGIRLRHRRTGKTGVVRSIRGSKVELQFDVLRMTVPVADLQRVEEPLEIERAVTIDSNAARSSAQARLELDIRGYRYAEAVDALEEQLDAAILQHLTRFSIIHGTGTGALRKGVHEYLQTRPEVGSFEFAPADQGGFGKTVVELVQRSG